VGGRRRGRDEREGREKEREGREGKNDFWYLGGSTPMTSSGVQYVCVTCDSYDNCCQCLSRL